MIVIGFISPGQVATVFTNSLLDLMREEERISGYISLVSGPGISTARCNVVRAFLDMKNKPEWLLMLDADMSFDPDICQKFIDAAHEKIRPVVGGLCFGGGRVGVPFPTLYRIPNPANSKGKLTEIIEDYPDNALCKVDATGAACLFIHRDVLLQMYDKFGTMPDGHRNPHPWFSETAHGGHEYGEDWTFCMRLKQMKVPLYVHTGIKLGHVKTQLYNEEFYKQHRRNNG